MLRSSVQRPIRLIVLYTCAAVLAVSTSSCGDSSRSGKSPNEKPTPSGSAKLAPIASPTPKKPSEGNTVRGTVSSPVVSGSEKTPYAWADGRIECTLNSGSSTAGCKIVKPEIAPQQEQRKRFLFESKFGCNAGPLYLALWAGDGRMVLPLNQGKSDSAIVEELVLEGPGPVMLQVLDQKNFDRAIIKRDNCFLSINLKSIEDVK
jgi:hypothetical protein